jgi:hypothetical protein
MDTPLHARAVPDADPATLKQPNVAARELADRIVAAVTMQGRDASARTMADASIERSAV